MKKWITMVLALALMMSGCGAAETFLPVEVENPTAAAPKQEQKPAETVSVVVPENFTKDPETAIEAYVESVIDSLTAEYESLVADVDSYGAYIAKREEIAAFYQKINRTSEEFCIQMRVFALECAETVLTSGKTPNDMYEDIEVIYDLIYDDMGDEIYDEIYDGILDDLYDDLYDEALEDYPEDVKYADWSEVRSAEYKQWSDTRSDTYEHWSDFRKDVYGFWSDLQGELWGDDLEDAWEEVEDFREDVEKMSSKKTSTDAVASGMRPGFKETMDSYEAFFDAYAAFMQAYWQAEDPLGMMGDYTAMMQQYVETMGELEDIDEDELSDEEALYYAEVMLRINQKLLEVI